MTTKEDKTLLEPFSHSKLTAVDQCPTWGIIRYGHAKQYETSARALALEAGAQMHEVYAAVRLWQLEHIQKQPRLSQGRAHEIFGIHRWGAARSNQLDDRENLLELAFNILHSGPYYDDPGDNIRTISNMETATIKYVDEQLEIMEYWPIYFTKAGFIGVEQAVDCTLFYSNGIKIRYIGTIDGVMLKIFEKPPPLVLGENKTMSRLDDAWRMSFELSHQVTGYCVLGTTLLGLPVFKTKVFGLKIKQTGHHEDYVPFEPQDRTEEMIQVWARWVYQIVTQDYYPYFDNWELASRRTHSCNRFYRPCAMIPFCADTPEGRREQYQQMVDAEPSPSEKAVADI